MKKNQITKNQHFVPRCLLKGFSDDEGLVNIYDSFRDVVRPATKITRVMAENYFYDKNNEVENYLAEYVEGPAAPVIAMLASGNFKLNDIDKTKILKFIVVQLNRTPSVSNTINENLDSFFEGVKNSLADANEFDRKDFEGIKLKFDDEKGLFNYNLMKSILYWPLIDDLKWHFLVTSSEVGFYICDHPVVHYNWYCKDRNDPRYTSIFSEGIQIFLPISSAVCLCLYDSNVYDMEKKDQKYHI